MRVFLFLFAFFLLPNNSVSGERSYKNLQPLDDSELVQAGISNHKDSNSPKIKQDTSLPIHAQQLLDSCELENTKLLFNGDEDVFKEICHQAFKAGANRAGYLLGTQLLGGSHIKEDTHLGIKYIEESASKGYNPAKRKLLKILTDPHYSYKNVLKALDLAKELNQSTDDDDIYASSTILVSYGTKREAQKAYQKLIKLAVNDYKKAYISLALAKIKYGHLHNLKEAKSIFYKNKFIHNKDYAFLPVLIDIMDNNFHEARKKLSSCESYNSTCNCLYFRFLTLGIGGGKDYYAANDIIEKGYQRWGKHYANYYAWTKATASAPPLYNPKQALKALNDIPEKLKNRLYVRDTFAAVYAANGMYEKAFKLQKEITQELVNNAFSGHLSGYESRLNTYEKQRRWQQVKSIKQFVNELQGIDNLMNVQKEIANL